MSRARVALVLLGDAMLLVALVMITQIDKLVNSTLYGYGLAFDDAWAQPYWLMLRVCMVSIVAAIVLISVVELPVPAFQEKTETGEVEEAEAQPAEEAEKVEEPETAEEQPEEQPVGVIEPELQER
jgi:hypothetical protein